MTLPLFAKVMLIEDVLPVAVGISSAWSESGECFTNNNDGQSDQATDQSAMDK